MHWERGPYACKPYQANNLGIQYEGRDAWGGEKELEPVFLVVVKRILILVTHTTPERRRHKSDKLERRKATTHMS